MRTNKRDLMERISSLCKRRGIIFPSSEIYGGLANTWDFGPLGVELKENIKREWWKLFVQQRSDIVGIDSAIIINPQVWEASGHLAGFSDPLTECCSCHQRFRVDHLVGDKKWKEEKEAFEKIPEDEQKIKIQEIIKTCPNCGQKKTFTTPRNFNLMLKTFLGPIEDENDRTYLRPETAQGIFVNFQNILGSSRQTIPFGIAQIGKAFRNEITPRNYIFRTREFEMMEIEYFIAPPKNKKEWQVPFEEWRKLIREWIAHLGIDQKNINELDVPKEELAHYSKKTIDFEYHFPFGLKELYGLAYRTDFDLKNHEEHSRENLKYRDPLSSEKYWPHVIEPSLGVERTLLAVLVDSYREEVTPEGETRIVMKFPAWLSPIKVAILPLVKNNNEIVSESRAIYNRLMTKFVCEYDESGTIGRRYRRQDEIGTPLAVTIDFQTLEDKKVTVRERDTMKQERVAIEDLEKYLSEKIND